MAAIDWFPLALSLRVALMATAMVIVIGVALGWLLARRRFFGRELLDAFVTLPLVLPPTVLGYYLLVLLGRPSFIGRAIESLTGETLVFTWRGAVLAAAIGALPLVVKTTRAAIAAVDGDLEDAARTLGQSEGRGFLRGGFPPGPRRIPGAGQVAFLGALGGFRAAPNGPGEP